MRIDHEELEDGICALTMLDRVGRRSDQEAVALAILRGRTAYFEMSLQLRDGNGRATPLFLSILDSLRARLYSLGARV
ncbi:MAG TPA: hypothetical protein VMD25_07725 [Acidobacteriaceae bacterium]|nr:hypothetical protein [Acidobacteriaceae bacterium]